MYYNGACNQETDSKCYYKSVLTERKLIIFHEVYLLSRLWYCLPAAPETCFSKYWPWKDWKPPDLFHIIECINPIYRFHSLDCSKTYIRKTRPSRRCYVPMILWYIVTICRTKLFTLGVCLSANTTNHSQICMGISGRERREN